MTRALLHRSIWLAATAALIVVLYWLDQTRGGPATELSRCNFLLSRSEAPAADVLIVGSSRTGAALDPVAMQAMLEQASAGNAPRVERLALGNSPLRASYALLDNYLETRGEPQVIALEIMFMTERSIDRLGRQNAGVPAEQTIFRRDVNLMTFSQILGLPAVAMPYSEPEGVFNTWRFRLRGVVLRAGALVYEFLHDPFETWDVSSCDRDDWTREPTWPDDFAFSYGDFIPDGPPAKVIAELEGAMHELAPKRSLQAWQRRSDVGQRYPYDFAASYREGELAILRSMLEAASRRGIEVVLLPLPLYGFATDTGELAQLATSLPPQARVFDVYSEVRGDLDKFWYDDGHLEPHPAGALTTALVAQHLLDTGSLDNDIDGTADD